MTPTLPVVELGSPGSARALRRACEREGFFYLARHDVDDALTAELRSLARAFFSLPIAAKLELHFERESKQRGYIPLRAEATDPGMDSGDVKEALDFTFPIPPEGANDPIARRMYGRNLWPRELPALQTAVKRYFDEMIRLGRSLFATISESFDLPPTYFDDKTDRPIAQLRLLHYPPQPPHAASLGIGAHCDYECFTILDPGEVGGLQIQKDDAWVNVEPVPGTFVVNLGEMLSRWTNDILRATPHRVLNRSGDERYTIPFFFGTNYDTTIECLPPCTGPERPPRYPPVRAGDYLVRRLNEIYGSLLMM